MSSSTRAKTALTGVGTPCLTGARDRAVEKIDLGLWSPGPKVEQQRGRLGPARARDPAGQQRARDRARQRRDRLQRAHRIVRQVDRSYAHRAHHRADLTDGTDLEREDHVEVHQPTRQHVEDRARRIGDHVERELAPFERAPIVDHLHREAGRGERRDQPVERALADRRECQTAPFGRLAVTVAIAIDRDRQGRRHHVLGTERGRQLLLVADAVLGRDEHARLGRTDGLAQRLDRPVCIVRFGRDDGHVGVDRRDVGERARCVGDAHADRLETIAQKCSDGALADDVDVHPCPVLPKPPSPRAESGSASTSSKRPRETGAITICAIRSPRRTTNGSLPRLARITPTGPR